MLHIDVLFIQVYNEVMNVIFLKICWLIVITFIEICFHNTLKNIPTLIFSYLLSIYKLIERQTISIYLGTCLKNNLELILQPKFRTQHIAMDILKSVAWKPTQSQPYITGINMMRHRVSTLRGPKIDVLKINHSIKYLYV